MATQINANPSVQATGTTQNSLPTDIQQLDSLLEQLQQDPSQASNPTFVAQVSSVLTSLANDFNSGTSTQKDQYESQYGMVILDLKAAGLITTSGGNITPSGNIQGALQSLASQSNDSFLSMTISDIGMVESNNGEPAAPTELLGDTRVLDTLLTRLSGNPSLANSPDFANEFNAALTQFVNDYNKVPSTQGWEKDQVSTVVLDLEAAGFITQDSSGNLSLNGNVGQELQNLSSNVNKSFLNKVIADMGVAGLGNSQGPGGPVFEDLKAIGELIIDLDAAPSLGTSPLFIKEMSGVLEKAADDYNGASSTVKEELAPVVSAMEKAGLLTADGSGTLHVSGTVAIAIVALSQDKPELKNLIKVIAEQFAPPSSSDPDFEAPRLQG